MRLVMAKKHIGSNQIHAKAAHQARMWSFMMSNGLLPLFMPGQCGECVGNAVSVQVNRLPVGRPAPEAGLGPA